MIMQLRIISLIVITAVLSMASSREKDPKEDSSRHREIQIAMPDGVFLSTDVYLPWTRRKVPAVLVRTPYNKNNESWLGKASRFFKIAVVVQDVRGKYGSEGEFYPFRFPKLMTQQSMTYLF